MSSINSRAVETLAGAIGLTVELELADRSSVTGTLEKVDENQAYLSAVSFSVPDSGAITLPECQIELDEVTRWGFLFKQGFCDPPQICRFRKITPVNGFDAVNTDNAMQNNYAWSMAELGDYIYVGTARNIPYSILSNQVLGDIPVPPSLIPQNFDPSGEIWRYKKDGSSAWQRVYKAPPAPMNIGFRYMVNYKNALYAGALTPLSPDLVILKSETGNPGDWQVLTSSIQGFSTRIMVEHQGVLYMGALPLMGVATAQLFRSEDPEGAGWTPVDLAGDPDKNPRGNIDMLLSFNEHLYVGTARPTGFEIWRTKEAEPVKDEWVLVVDQGAGDARNEHPWSWDVFADHIYIGSAIEAGILSINPEDRIVPPKGFDLIRVNKQDQWELIVGGKPVVPTQPATGVRRTPLSGFPSGFGDITNGYCWQIRTFDGELYLGTWSWNDLIPPFLPIIPEIIEELLPDDSVPNSIAFLLNTIFSPVLSQVIYLSGRNVLGFDLWKTKDGTNWLPVSLNGFSNPNNYGVRILFVSEDGPLYVGTANPFQGCEVWMKQPLLGCGR